MMLREILEGIWPPKQRLSSGTRRHVRLRLERLEDRTVPTLAWHAAPADPLWSTPANWVDTLDPNQQPAGPPAGHDVIFDSFYSTAGSVVDGVYSANLVNWNGASDGNILVIPTGSNININNYFNHYGTLWVSPGATVRAQGDFSLTDGTISGGAGMTIAIGGTFADAGTIISGQSLEIDCGAFVQQATAPIDVTGAMMIRAQTSITLDGPITGGGVLILNAPLVKIRGTITLTGTDATNPPGLVAPGPDALTVGTWINEHGFMGAIGSSPDPPPGSLDIPAAIFIAGGGSLDPIQQPSGTVPPRTLDIQSSQPSIEPFASVTVENGFVHVSSALDLKGTLTVKNTSTEIDGAVDMVGGTLTATYEANGAPSFVTVHGAVAIDPDSAVSVNATILQIDADIVMHGGTLDIASLSTATIDASIQAWSPAAVTITQSTVIVGVDFDMVNEPIIVDKCILTVNNDSQTPIVQILGLPGQTGIVVVGNFDMPPDTTVNLSGGKVAVGGTATQNGGTVSAIGDAYDAAEISTGGAYLAYGGLLILDGASVTAAGGLRVTPVIALVTLSIPGGAVTVQGDVFVTGVPPFQPVLQIRGHSSVFQIEGNYYQSSAVLDIDYPHAPPIVVSGTATLGAGCTLRITGFIPSGWEFPIISAAAGGGDFAVFDFVLPPPPTGYHWVYGWWAPGQYGLFWVAD